MAASSKPTGVHVALIIFVLISIACGVGWLMAYKGAGSISELKKERDDAKEKLKTAETQFRAKDEDVKKLKDALGALSEDVGADSGEAQPGPGQRDGEPVARNRGACRALDRGQLGGPGLVQPDQFVGLLAGEPPLPAERGEAVPLGAVRR